MYKHGTIDTKILLCVKELESSLKSNENILLHHSNESGSTVHICKDMLLKIDNLSIIDIDKMAKIGISINSNQLTTDIDYIDKQDILFVSFGGFNFSGYYKVADGDILRIHTNGIINTHKGKGMLSISEDIHREGMMSIFNTAGDGSLSFKSE